MLKIIIATYDPTQILLQHDSIWAPIQRFPSIQMEPCPIRRSTSSDVYRSHLYPTLAQWRWHYCRPLLSVLLSLFVTQFSSAYAFHPFFWISPLKLVRMPRSLVSRIKSCYCSRQQTIANLRSISATPFYTGSVSSYSACLPELQHSDPACRCTHLYTAVVQRITLFKGGTAHRHHLLSRQALRFTISLNGLGIFLEPLPSQFIRSPVAAFERGQTLSASGFGVCALASVGIRTRTYQFLPFRLSACDVDTYIRLN